MLIRSIRAEGFMRFSRLSLTGLPLRGIIGIEGPNETGKSTLGEILLFALFGRTRTAVSGPVTSLIRWGADSLNVEVEFALRSAQGNGVSSSAYEEYLICRLLDRYGTNYVKILKLPEREEVATGNARAAEFIARRVGFGFNEFLQSFYHEQHESRKLQPEQVAFFESATGVKQLQQAQDSLRRDIEPLEREFSFLQKEIARNRAQAEKYAQGGAKLADLGARLARIPEQLEAEEKKLAEARRRTESLRAEGSQMEVRVKALERLPDQGQAELLGELGRLGDDRLLDPIREVALKLANLRAAVVAATQDRERLLDAARAESPAGRLQSAQARGETMRRRGRRRLVAGLVALLLAAALGGALWRFWGAELPPEVAPAIRQLWPRAAVGAAVLFGLVGVLFLLGAARARRASAAAQREAAGLVPELETARAEHGALREALASSTVRQIGAFVQGVENTGVASLRDQAGELKRCFPPRGEEPQDQRVEKLFQGILKSERDQRSRLLNEAQKMEKCAQDESAARRVETERARLDTEIKECHAQLAKKAVVEEKSAELDASAARVREEIDVRLSACRLIEESTSSMRARLGPALTRYVKSILPLLTQGRYRDVRVEQNLEIKVYSGEKNDFLSLCELSGGTCEALCLALRLGISHALVATRARRAQFVFLDEPFRMMDAGRAAETLRVLPRLSPDLEQFFVARPNFSAAERELFDVVITTSAGDHVLELDVSAKEAAASLEPSARPA